MRSFFIIPALAATAFMSQASEQKLFNTQELTSPFVSAADALKGGGAALPYDTPSVQGAVGVTAPCYKEATLVNLP